MRRMKRLPLTLVVGRFRYEVDELIDDKLPNSALVACKDGEDVVVLYWDHVRGAWWFGDMDTVGPFSQMSWLEVGVESEGLIELAGVGPIAGPVTLGRRENQVGPVLWSDGKVIGEAVLEGWEGPDGELLEQMRLTATPLPGWDAPSARERLSVLAG